MIDWKRVSELRAEIGAEDFGDIVEIFLEEVEESVVRLNGTVPAGDLEGLMHFLKGSALNLGFQDFADQCMAAEQIAAGRAEGTIDQEAIAACYQASRAEFLSGLESRFAA